MVERSPIVLMSRDAAPLPLKRGQHTMTKQQLRISLSDLPARSRSMDDDATAGVFGGCVGLYGVCTGDAYRSNCCPTTINNTGSGRFKLGCIGFSSGNTRICNWVNV
jgi:hypothetical protein